MSLSDLTSILEAIYTHSEIVEMLDSISKTDIEEYAVKNYVCPRCYSNLVEHRWKEKSEHFGFPAEESQCELLCEGCGDVW